MNKLRSTLFLFATCALIGGAAQAATLTATPNPCVAPPGEVLCTTQVSWSDAPDNAVVSVTVIQTGQTAVMARGSNGSVTVPWIYIGNTYRFDLTAIGNGGFAQYRRLYGSVKVSGRASAAY